MSGTIWANPPEKPQKTLRGKPLNYKFGIRLDEILRAKNWESDDLFDAMMGIEGTPETLSEKTIQGWLDCKSVPRGEMLVSLSKALGVTTDYLLCVTDYNIVEDVLNSILGELEKSRRTITVTPLSNINITSKFILSTHINWGGIYSSEQNHIFSYPVSQEYVISSNGNIYTTENYDILGYKETKETETIYSIVNKAVELNEPKLITRIRTAYNKNRPFLGALGELGSVA